MAIYESYVDSMDEDVLPASWSADQHAWFEAATFAEEMGIAFAGKPLGDWWDKQVNLCWARIQRNIVYAERYTIGEWQ